MTEDAVYMDYNAGAPIREDARAALTAALGVGNASSVHAFGRAARRIVEDARGDVAALVGGDPEGVIFTSGATEANNLALKGSGCRRVLVSAIEHPSVLEVDGDCERIAVDGEGVVDLNILARMLDDDDTPAMVCVMAANNETGVLQPLREIARLAHDAGALVHCDAVQAVGKVALDMAELGVDTMSLSAHKIGGPQGAGALLLAAGGRIDAEIRGGAQEKGFRAGTENVAAIAGFGAAARAVRFDAREMARVKALRDDLERRVRAICSDVRIFSAAAERLANTSCLTMPDVVAQTQVMAFDLAGIALSAGAACASGKVRPSHVLGAMGASSRDASCALRVSLGYGSTARDIDRFIDAWGVLYTRMHNTAATANPAA
ncbi:cysteine desulfurase family protein [Varunaivibrio sulfuroxidans]|nr:cysteine desulfurase family protein [Varunaivibrio sulfuroxidans]WES30594.1 cysteine desulfurase family protein [Varunaivibrio sulfuroxidans]